METTQVYISTLREFVEKALGFEKPVSNVQTLRTAFDFSETPASPNTAYYSALKGYLQASLNAITPQDWERNHIIEGGSVLWDVLRHPSLRVYNYLSAFLAKQGLALQDRINAKQGESLQELCRCCTAFYKRYSQHHSAELGSSLTLRKVDDKDAWDVLIRVAIFDRRSGESMYVQQLFPEFIQGVARLILPEQGERTELAVEGFLNNFGEEASHLLQPYGPVYFSKTICHMLVNRAATSHEEAYAAFCDMVQANLAIMDANETARAQRLVPWGQLTDLQRKIIVGAVEIARVFLTTTIAYNTALAKPEQFQ